MPGPERVLILGAGTMGCGIAALWAKAGHSVVLYDPMQDARSAAKARVASLLGQLVEARALLADQIDPAVTRVDTTGDLDAAVDATFIIEAVPENLVLKRQILGDLDRLASPQTVLASNSTSITLAESGVNVLRKDRFLATHFYNPAHLIPLVEIASTPDTAEWAIEKAFNLMTSLGKVPVRCADSSGYIGSRLQLPMVMEAIKMVQEGIATPEDIDKAIRNSWGPRVAVMGPMEMADRGGLDIWLISGDRFAEIYGDSKFRGPDLLRDMVARGELGVKTGKGLFGDTGDLVAAARDRQLLALLQYLGRLPVVDEPEVADRSSNE